MIDSNILQNIQGLLCEDIYQLLINILEYKDNPHFRADQSGIYDMLYYVRTEEEEYPIVGIKCLEHSNEAIITKQHLLYWNRNDVPLSILVLSGELRIYNNFTRTKALLYNSNSQQNGECIINDLKASRIATTLVWERLTKLSNSSERVDKQLLSNLRNTVLLAQNEYGMPLENAYNFMSLCIFVKYLEDRGMITSQFFLKWNVNTFTDFLENTSLSELNEFFLILKDRFNGDLFVISKHKLPSKKQLDIFYRFFRGDDILTNGNSQLRLFPYNFSVIPIGLISNIYETFFSLNDENRKEKTANKTGAFYTPYFLADYMIKQSFSSYMSQNKIPCILDPACGSGIFLVNSFKCQIEMLKKIKGKLGAKELCCLIENNVYGIDINPNALRISCFSLYIALLDELTPKDIMENNFKFPNLIGKNLIEGSFFSLEIDICLSGKQFDIIVGNPPWKSITYSDHMLYSKSRRIPIADAQIAQAFLVRSGDFANDKTEILLLVTNSVFTNKKCKKFLRYFFDNFCIEKIINLEAVKTQLFVHAQYPCSILKYHCMKRGNYEISYQVFRANALFKLLHKFVCDKNEEIFISNTKLENREYIWTILTYGDEFDVECIEYLLSFPPLSKSINGKLDFVQGYITASNGCVHSEFDGYRGGSLKNVFFPYGIDYENVPIICPNTLYDSPRNIGIYTCPHKVLVKRTYNEKCWGAAYIQEPLIFSNDFSTFNDYTGENIDLLRYIEGMINSDVFRYYSFYMTKVKAAKKPEVVKEDIMKFPVPIFDIENAEIKNIVNLVMQIEQQVRNEWELKRTSPWSVDEMPKIHLQEELNKCIFRLYNFDSFHISIIKEGINRFSEGQQIGIYANENDYNGYADYLCDYFNYFMKQDSNGSWKQIKQEGDFYTIMFFSFNNSNSEECLLSPDVVGLLGFEEINARLLVQRQVFLFMNNGFQIVQSREKSNWTLSKAKKMAAKITREIMHGGRFYE